MVILAALRRLSPLQPPRHGDGRELLWGLGNRRVHPPRLRVHWRGCPRPKPGADHPQSVPPASRLNWPLILVQELKLVE
jgi:hypothetical protein